MSARGKLLARRRDRSRARRAFGRRVLAVLHGAARCVSLGLLALAFVRGGR